jgi:hypothetical protein
VYASFGVWEADITNLNDPNTWTVTDHRCELAAQQPGPWSDVHSPSLAAGLSLCVDATRPSPVGAGFALAASPLQASLLWPQLSHSPDLNANDTRLYVGDQAGGFRARWTPVPMVRIIDLSKSPPRIIGEVEGPGHSLDGFRSASGREYVIHANEAGNAGVPGQAEGGDTCRRYPRPFSLGWGFEAFISDVTRPDKARNVSMIRIAINDPEFCEVRRASGSELRSTPGSIERMEPGRRCLLVSRCGSGLLRKAKRPHFYAVSKLLQRRLYFGGRESLAASDWCPMWHANSNPYRRGT